MNLFGRGLTPLPTLPLKIKALNGSRPSSSAVSQREKVIEQRPVGLSCWIRLLISAYFERGGLLIFLFAAVDHTDFGLVAAVFETGRGQGYPECGGTITFNFQGLFSSRDGLPRFVAVIVKDAPLHVDFAAVVRNLSRSVNLIAGLESLRLVLCGLVAAQLQAADIRRGCAACQYRSQQQTEADYQIDILTHVKFLRLGQLESGVSLSHSKPTGKASMKLSGASLKVAAHLRVIHWWDARATAPQPSDFTDD